jgi:hypothetical protein
MIHIDRPVAPAFLLDPAGKWIKETNRAIAHYQSGNTDAFDFKEYNDTTLKDALKLVFKKCAYCETSYGAVYDGDVEHFRPKGRVSEKTPKNPGYFWLANDWDNLLLACQHCNQRRQHILYGEDQLEGYGKLDQFPLSDEAKRKSLPGKLDEEDQARLLLHPCMDEPEKHLQYEKEVGVIFSETPMGIASIKVYALQRPLLVQERQKMLKLLFRQMLRVKRELERLNRENSEAQKEVFNDELDVLLEFGKDSGLYAGMCRYFLRQFLKENDLE